MPSGTIVEQKTGKLYGELWPQYDDALFRDSIGLFRKRWLANGEPEDFFQSKVCLDVGCGGGRYSFAMAQMGASAVTGVDVSEEGLADARRRGAALGFANVSFRQASALSLPFADGAFDFVCCSGVLHHTLGVERGLSEICRVLKPGGSLYLLLYGSGGLFWPLNYLMRAFANLLGREELERMVEQAGYPANRRRSVLDDLFVPVLETYPRERVEQLLRASGFVNWRAWEKGRMDHEADAQAMLQELEYRLRLWQPAVDDGDSTHPSREIIKAHAASICGAVNSAVRDLIEECKAGRLSEQQINDTVIGCGHHRIIAVRS